MCLIALALATAGCRTFNLPTPENFVERQSPHDEFRALNSNEDKLLVRHFTQRERQDLPFWAETVRKNLVEERGYTLIEENGFHTDAGVPGKRLLFEISSEDVAYRYLLVVFVAQTPEWVRWLLLPRRQHIYAAEFLCEKGEFEKNVPAVEKALKQFDPKRGEANRTSGSAE